MTLSISEILKKASEIKDKQERIDFLRGHRNATVIGSMFNLAYHPDIVWLLPEEAPPYTPCPYPDSQGMLLKEARRLYLFLANSGAPEMTQLKREQLYIGLLESIDPEDAKLLVAIKDKKIPYKGLGKKFAEEAYPEMFPVQAKEETNV